MWKCKYCNKEFDFKTASEKANHSRWCDLNPKRAEYEKFLHERRIAMLSFKDKKITGIKKAWADGKYDNVDYSKNFLGKKHSEETKILLRDKALSSNHRRLRRNCIEYKGILLDSTWEYELAKRLDFLNIKWIRPEPLKWKDLRGLEHHYFPDFYLLDYDLFLDPKNPIAYKVQKEKIDILNNTYSNIKFLTSIDECINFII
jgi:hypothetical protein